MTQKEKMQDLWRQYMKKPDDDFLDFLLKNHVVCLHRSINDDCFVIVNDRVVEGYISKIILENNIVSYILTAKDIMENTKYSEYEFGVNAFETLEEAMEALDKLKNVKGGWRKWLRKKKHC